MNNMGGLRKLWYIDADDFVSLVEGQNSIYTLTLENGAAITAIDFTPGTGKISENEETTDHGTVFNFEASCRVPKCGADNKDLLGGNKDKKLLILGEDENENFWLIGSPGSYFNINTSSSTGESQQDTNGRQLRISASLPEGSVFITSPF